MISVSELPYVAMDGEDMVEFEYPLDVGPYANLFPSVKEVLLRAVMPTADGIMINDAKLLAEAIDWVRARVHESAYRVDGRYRMIVRRTTEGEDVLLDDSGIRWGAIFRFLRDDDAAYFALRFA